MTTTRISQHSGRLLNGREVVLKSVDPSRGDLYAVITRDRTYLVVLEMPLPGYGEAVGAYGTGRSCSGIAWCDVEDGDLVEVSVYDRASVRCWYFGHVRW